MEHPRVRERAERDHAHRGRVREPARARAGPPAQRGDPPGDTPRGGVAVTCAMINKGRLKGCHGGRLKGRGRQKGVQLRM